ncbi:phosphoglucomutase/phosphomannomutase PgmG [Aestuariispira insulae]|uniref:Phosphomannomutase n=1 Tax=Aestuariispira insulae TaxID=1461337 RepID=A0A3D9HJZ4_9PROT|nr:phosphomannomutase/phosphoglucomutase [Aestuariispira insulae]RED49810.1 phosphomannomutase [Aestuariispira insulae]
MTIGHRFNPTILREYDIRGVVGSTLTPSDALALGRTLGTIAAAKNGRIAVVGYDGRTSSPVLEEEMCRGLAACGLYVIRIGLVPTPALYFTSKVLDAAVGVMITGSHNPPEYNGFKIVMNNRPFFGQEIQQLQDLAYRGVWINRPGGVIQSDSMSAYVARLLKDHKRGRQLKVAWDPGNGAAGEATLRLARGLPGDHVVINEKIDGTFPNHHPDPTVEENLEQLKQTVLEEKCDLGVAFDGDGDRIGVVDNEGTVIWGDQLLAILARDVLANIPGAPVLADVKASQVLFNEIERLGGKPVMSPTGHSIIKSKMAETGAPLAGEMSGHVFFADRYFGFDDALYAAVRLIGYLGSQSKSLSELRQELPSMVNTPEIRVDVSEERKFDIVSEVKERLAAEGADVNDIDGVRVNEGSGWWLIRASNTQNALVLRCEAENDAELAQLKQRAVQQLTASGVGIQVEELG